MRWLALAALCAAATAAAAQGRMREAVEAALTALPERNRAQAMRPFDDRDRTEWHYTPRTRNGLSLKEMDPAGREAVHALLRTALSASGYRKVVNIIELELVLREIETIGWMRDPERYHLTVYGTPDAAKRWGWRFEGHHLSLNFTLAGDKMAVDSPSFFGANPATVQKGARKGMRALGDEHDAGWALLDALSEAQRREALLDVRPYGDIVTGVKDKVEPLPRPGLPARSSTRSSARCSGSWSRSTPAISIPRSRRPGSRGPARAASRRSASAGPAPPRAARRTTTACRARASSSSTTRRRATATTYTRCGATSVAISAATCCANITPPCAAHGTGTESRGCTTG